MIYTIPYQSEELLKSSYFKLRNTIDPKCDKLHLTVANSHLHDLPKEEIYKKVLKLEGMYRTENSSWTTEPIQVRIINHL